LDYSKLQEELRPETKLHSTTVLIRQLPAPPLQMAVSNTGNLCTGLRSFHFHLSSPATPAALPSSSSGEEAAVTTALSPPLPPAQSNPAPESRLSLSRKWAV
jgi:hypothetical protein